MSCACVYIFVRLCERAEMHVKVQGQCPSASALCLRCYTTHLVRPTLHCTSRNTWCAVRGKCCCMSLGEASF
jgi:hypothetical protein